jgi:LysM repeat protein
MSNFFATSMTTLGSSLILASSAGVLPAQASPSVPTKPVAPIVAPVPTPAPIKTYIVVSGDNLSAIAASEGLDSWRPIWNANVSLTDPNLIYPDQSLVIPSTLTTDRPVPVEQAATAAALDQTSIYNTSVIQRSAPTRAVNYAAGSQGIFARIRQRESGSNYAENTGNGYYGAYQYDLGTWGNYAGYARPDLAPPSVQDAKAAATYAIRGCSPWPNTCY